MLLLLPAAGRASDSPASRPTHSWPEPYKVQRDESAGVLTLSTRYYTVEHDLKKGGVIRRISLTHGRAANLLVRPIETRVLNERGTALSDLRDAKPNVQHRTENLNEIVGCRVAAGGSRWPSVRDAGEDDL